MLALTNPGDLIVDPYVGVGSAACAALVHKRRAAGSDLSAEYLKIAADRIEMVAKGVLPRRPLVKEVYVPGPNDKIAQRPAELGLFSGRRRIVLEGQLFA